MITSSCVLRLDRRYYNPVGAPIYGKSSVLRMPMSPREIKELLTERGISQTIIAHAAKVSSTQVHRVVYGRDKSPRIRKVIARMLGVPVEHIWPVRATEASHAA
jgi:lambda repressor-like predicted transcriptional regulator